jgi:hypothetical protein
MKAVEASLTFARGLPGASLYVLWATVFISRRFSLWFQIGALSFSRVTTSYQQAASLLNLKEPELILK